MTRHLAWSPAPSRASFLFRQIHCTNRSAAPASSKVIAVSNPIKVNCRCRVILPRAAAPFDIAIERIDPRRRAVKNQIAIPPQLNLAVLPSVEIGDVPGVGYSRAEVHYLRIGVHITPEFVTAIDKRDGR